MIAYADGTPAIVGDAVDFDGEASIVDAVIDSSEDRALWGLEERGLMLRNKMFGLLFTPAGAFDWASVALVGRAG